VIGQLSIPKADSPQKCNVYSIRSQYTINSVVVFEDKVGEKRCNKKWISEEERVEHWA